jgi:hypothetical protein
LYQGFRLKEEAYQQGHLLTPPMQQKEVNMRVSDLQVTACFETISSNYEMDDLENIFEFSAVYFNRRLNNRDNRF